VLPEPECSWSVGGDRARDKNVVLPQNQSVGLFYELIAASVAWVAAEMHGRRSSACRWHYSVTWTRHKGASNNPCARRATGLANHAQVMDGDRMMALCFSHGSMSGPITGGSLAPITGAT